MQLDHLQEIADQRLDRRRAPRFRPLVVRRAEPRQSADTAAADARRSARRRHNRGVRSSAAMARQDCATASRCGASASPSISATRSVVAAQMQRLGVAGDDLDQEIVVDRKQKSLRAGAHFDRCIDVARQPQQRRRRRARFRVPCHDAGRDPTAAATDAPAARPSAGSPMTASPAPPKTARRGPRARRRPAIHSARAMSAPAPPETIRRPSTGPIARKVQYFLRLTSNSKPSHDLP